MANDKKNQPQIAEAKQSVITVADLRSPKRIRIPGFRGSFMDSHFDDEGISDTPVNPETIDALQKQFPEIVIQNV
jgi:hypothetical protein